uniref:SAM domain-containing protein n=1 Tax=Acrobeloides nanus TaxID=290746 RepID=A0A914BZQ6_9BILA
MKTHANDMKVTEPMEQEIQEISLPEGVIEERVQVDRKRLEKMILHEGFLNKQELPNAEEFFSSVERKSGATVSWPTRLKIGAKTKKDPYVKVIGYPEQVQVAAEMVRELLKVKKDRVTLKMEICHNSHSHIIGRGGRNTQKVMAETHCHIHFPDSNKHNDVEKNNQVSIAGTIEQVEKARAQLRMISPVSVTFTILLGERPLMNLSELQRLLSIPEVNISQQNSAKSNPHYSIKSSVQHESKIIEAICRIHEIYGINSLVDLICYSSFDLRPALLQSSYGLFHHNTVSMIAIQTNTSIQFSPQDPCIIISGPPQCIFLARKFLTGLLPLSIQFEKPAHVEILPTTRSLLEKELEVTILEKKKSNTTNNESMVAIRSYEANVIQVYAAKHRLVDPNSNIHITEEYAFMKDLFQMTKMPSMYNQPCSLPGPHLTPSGRTVSDSNMATKSNEKMSEGSILNPKSPDPTESPIAHSLLSTAKKSETEPWKLYNNEKHAPFNREQLLLMANRATYVSDVKADIRLPTSLWAGYGFSNSLPADILKLGLRDNANSSNNQANYSKVTEIKPIQNVTQEFSRLEGRPIVGRGGCDFESDKTSSLLANVSINKGLASVREEEELSDYNHSYSSNFEDPTSNVTNQTAQFPLPRIFKKTTFAASTGVFESSPPISNEFVWDIKTFGDPALVLAQLGCGEYLPQFRDQEIDMQAFLLLDEQNLKDIGVSTMGARKKIFNAILKLRDSAAKYGYVL